MDKVNIRFSSFEKPLENSVPKKGRTYSVDPSISKVSKDFFTSNLPKTVEKADLGEQGRLIADAGDDFRSIATSIEGLFPSENGGATFGGNTSFQSGMRLYGAINILLGGANASDEIELAKKSEKHTARGVHVMKASRGIIGVLNGITSTLKAGFSLGAISNTSSAITNGLATLKSISGPLGSIFLSALVVPRCIEINKAILIQKTIKDKSLDGFKLLYKTNPGAIELALPDVYKKLKDGKKITVKELYEISKGLNESIKMNLIRVIVSSVALLLSVLGAVLTTGVAPLAILIATLVVNLMFGAIDVKSIIEMLKKAVNLTNKDIVIKVLTIVLALTAAVVSVVLAPSVGLQIAAGVASGVMALIPVVSLVAVSMKVKRLEEDKKARKKQEAMDADLKELNRLREWVARESGEKAFNYLEETEGKLKSISKELKDIL